MSLPDVTALSAPASRPAVRAIHVTGLSKRFGNVAALNGIDLDVGMGEIVALLGPNGAGKSTLMRVLSTILLPDYGRVCVAGVDAVKDPRSVQRALGVSFGEERAWYWRITGRQNLEFFAALYGLTKERIPQRIADLLEQFSLAHVADRPFNTYSSGMKARFSLIRALLPSPAVLLLDEPTRSLDPIAASDFRNHVLRQRDLEGTAVFLATHSMHEAAVLADRIAVLVNGRIVATVDHGPSAEELERLLIGMVNEWS